MSEERAQRISKARTARAEDFRLARLAVAAAAQAERDAAEDAEVEAAGGDVDRRLLTLVIKADVQGSAEAVSQAVMQLSSDKVRTRSPKPWTLSPKTYCVVDDVGSAWGRHGGGGAGAPEWPELRVTACAAHAR